MSFLNKYNKEQGYAYTTLTKIGEYIYGIGTCENIENSFKSLITKLDTNGGIVWEKKYDQTITNCEVIECTNGDLLLLGQLVTETALKPCLTRINSATGAIVWQKAISFNQNFYPHNGDGTNLLNIGNENYILALNYIHVLGSSSALIIKFNSLGEIITSKVLSSDLGGFSFYRLVKGDSKIAVYGDGIIPNFSGAHEPQDIEKSLIFELDYNLTQIISTIASNNNGIMGCFYRNNFIYVFNWGSNFISTEPILFFNKLSKSNNTISNHLSKLYFGNTKVILNNDQNFYLENYDQNYSYISKIDFDFKPQWTKRYEFVSTHYAFGCLSQIKNNSILILDKSSNYGYGTTVNNFTLGSLDLDLNSCRTQDLDVISITDKHLDYYLGDFNFTLTNLNLELVLIPLPNISTLVSKKEEVCPTIVENPCIKDEKICALYNQILDVQINCLQNPENTTIEDYKKYVKCFSSILDLLFKFNELNPNYSLVSVFEEQIRIIKSYVENPSAENYVQAWNAVQFMLNYLSKLGNCNCDHACVKDEKICAFYNQLLDIQVKCLKEPTKKIKSETFIDCFSKGLDLILSFIKANAKEEWISFFNQYIRVIKLYLENPTLENYTNAYQAFDFILNYISQYGNCNCENSFEITDFASIQSGQLYLQSAGSQGEDSTKGIHLRWTFRDKLVSHLPKANYATTTFNFNKPNDFVKIYRAPYSENKIAIDFTSAPSLINDSNVFTDKHWVYAINTNYIFHVYFRDTVRYNQVRATIDPSIDPSYFIKNYGHALIEVENKTQLSFAVTPNFTENNSPSTVKLEILSVAENKITAPKTTTLRKEYKVADLNNQKLLSENIRSIRFLPTNAILQKLEFEFYSDFIIKTTKDKKWSFVTELALTKNTYVAYNRLEPQNHCLDNWLHFNEEAYVNTDNYKSRWNGNILEPIKNMNYVVDKYIQLSDTISNPLATETILLNATPEVQSCMVSNPNYHPNPNNSFNVSYLNLLQMASLDYHNARMLGLGVLDLNSSLFDGSYIYMAEYYTLVDLTDGVSSHKIQHLYCSLPTSIADERLPDAVDLDYIKPGVNNVDGSDTYELTDIDGYTKDNKSRYLSLFNKPVHKEIQNSAFYYTNYEFISSQKTNPVFVGLEYKKTSDSEWRNPELSHDLKYYDSNGIPETKVILIPPLNRPFYIHREKQSGEHQYLSYGINWFSRATNSILDPIKIPTALRPANELLPPSNVNALLIKKESPLALTSANEQVMFTTIPDTQDRTLIRLTFDYNHAQELISYHYKINGNIVPDYYELANQKEAFGDDIQVFFKNQIPAIVTGKVKEVFSGGNPVSIEVTTDVFPVLSSGINTNVPATNPPTYNEMYTPSIPSGEESNYIGSIMLVNGIEFIIQDIDNTGQYPKFTLFKADPNGEEVTLETVLDSTHVLLSPTVNSMFTIVENIQNSSFWPSPNPFPFTVNNVITNTITIDQTTVYREEINVTNPDCNVDTHVQKFRGIYEDAIIEKIDEKIDENHDGDYDLNQPASSPNDYVLKHQGIYKITFPGFNLAQHSQYQQTDFSVEFSTGIVRLHTFNNPAGPRKEFKVIKVENIGVSGMDLVLYVCDLTFPTNLSLVSSYAGRIMADNATQINQKVNYYPSYKVYFTHKPSFGFTEANLLPIDEEDFKYSVFALRSHDYPGEVIEDGFVVDNLVDYYSKMSQPAFMFAQANIAPQQPEKPLGGLYATRPDFFGKSTYTFKTKFTHKPYSVQFNRATDIQILAALYENNRLYDTNNVQTNYPNNVKDIMEDIFKNGEEPFYVNLWEDLLDFRPANTSPTLQTFTEADGSTVQLPIPNNPKFIESINKFIDAHNDYYHNLPYVVAHVDTSNLNLMTEIIPLENNADGTVRNEQLKFRDFIRDVVFNCFVPLTEIPIIYNLIKGQPSYFQNYKPIPKKQVVRDRNGDLLPQDHPDFDMAPMMRVIGNNETQFTDFGLDGASNAKYFYAVREFNSQMQTSDYSVIKGPINLVNSAPAIAPEIIKIIPVLENRTLGIAPCIQLQINAYNKTQNIKKINIYRATNANDSLSIRTMKLAKVIDFDIENLQDDSQWIFSDDFVDLGLVPFGDPLYYRITVSRRIKYTDKFYDDLAPSTVDQTIVDYAPSEASKMVLTNIVENYSPESPILNYTAGEYHPATDSALDYITLNWEQNMYKGNYHLYKMNAQGNWIEIIRVISDRLTAGVYHFYNQNAQGEWVNTVHPEQLVTFNNMIYLPLEVTNLATTSLATKTVDGKPIYHHLKVLSENTAGMFSKKENILTLYNADSYHSDAGISSDGIDGMIVQGNFIVRHNN